VLLLLVIMHSEAKAFFDANDPTDIFYDIFGELLAAVRNGAAARLGRMHASMHGRHAGSARGAYGCNRVGQTDSAAAAGPPPRWGPPPRPLVPPPQPYLPVVGPCQRDHSEQGCTLLIH
jgi:hypothetical protein